MPSQRHFRFLCVQSQKDQQCWEATLFVLDCERHPLDTLASELLVDGIQICFEVDVLAHLLQLDDIVLDVPVFLLLPDDTQRTRDISQILLY